MTNLTQNTIPILTETWLNEKHYYQKIILNKFCSISRSSKTGVNKGCIVDISVPRDISSKQRNDLNVHLNLNVLNEGFFQSLWVEIFGLSVNKILIKAWYCPNNVSANYFSDKFASETSLAYSTIDEFLFFGNYNLNSLK